MLVCMRHSTELEVWYWGSELLVTCKQTCCSDVNFLQSMSDFGLFGIHANEPI